MQRLTSSLAFLWSLLAVVDVASAGGLIFQLPPDGSWVRYELRENAECEYQFGKKIKLSDAVKDSLPRKLNSQGTLTLSSVGRADLQGETCRWIEIKAVIEMSDGTAQKPEAKTPKATREIVLKLLIPQKHLKPDSDPFAHVVKMYHKDGQDSANEITDEKWKKYELDRFRPLFPKPVADCERLAKQSVDTAEPTLGRIECERLSFASEYAGPLTRGTRGWWNWQAKHQLWLHENVPFGVASLTWTGTSEERNQDDPAQSIIATVKSTKRLVVSALGTDAKSALPNHN